MARPLPTVLTLALLALPAVAQRPSAAPPVAPPKVERSLLPGARLEVAYTPSGVSNGAQDLVLWLPDGPPPVGGFPVVAYFPGGGWQDPGPLPDEPNGLLALLRDQGVAVAHARYTTTSLAYPGGGKYPSMEHDAIAVVQHLRFNADRYLLDPERLFLFGRSAGGHGVQAAALWADRADPLAFDQRRESSKPDGVLLISVAATHVPALLQNFGSGLAPYLGGGTNKLTSVSLLTQIQASPTTWMDLDPAGSAQVPFLVIGSAREITAPLGEPYVSNAVDHKHDPWNAATLYGELLALGGVHPTHTVYVDTFTQPLTDAEIEAVQALWLQWILLQMDAGAL